MFEFPQKCSPKNKEFFKDFQYQRNLCYLRRDVYEHILKNNEDDYFDVSGFNEKYVKDLETVVKMMETIELELKNLGWNTKLCYGNTGLYIYSTVELPVSCGEDF
jgi:hypothetical protein